MAANFSASAFRASSRSGASVRYWRDWAATSSATMCRPISSRMAFSAGASVRIPEMTMGSFSAAGVWASSFSMSASTSAVCSSLVMKKALLKMSLRWAAVISG